MSNSPGPLEKIYHELLRAYPPDYLETFGDEMNNTFVEGLSEARSQGSPGLFLLREISDIPKSLLNAYWYGWQRKLLGGIQSIQTVMSSSDLPPAAPDGRESWRQVLWEMSLFLIAGMLLILATYFEFEGLPAGWQRDIELLRSVIAPLTAPFFLLGLVRGLPRWAYPFGGLLLGYYAILAGLNSLWLFLFLMLLAGSILALAAIVTDPHPSRLPVPIRRIGQSLSLDWTRLSFGLFGAMPLIILLAFDDAHADSRTPYLALAALAMIVSALLYCRSRDMTLQITSLLAGLTLSVWGAWLDKVSFANGLMNWIVVSSQASPANWWMFELWFQWTILILAPAVLITFSRVIYLRRAM